MSSEKKAIKALLKSFKKVKSISLVDKVTDAGKTISSFLFQVESKEGKKSKLEQWMEKLEEEKEPKGSKKKEKASDKKKLKEGKLEAKKSKDKKAEDGKLEDKKSKDKQSEGKKSKDRKLEDGKMEDKKLEDGKLKDGKKVKKNKEIKSAKSESPAKPESDLKKPEADQTHTPKASVKDSKVEKKTSHDLKLIEGVGPAVEKILVEAGYSTFDKLAKADSAKLMDLLLEKGGPRYKMFDPTTWPHQAALAADGKMDELKAMQLVLKGRGAK
jgi:predicted flap endonuclease-1-like 5' DNA nuclease